MLEQTSLLPFSAPQSESTSPNSGLQTYVEKGSKGIVRPTKIWIDLDNSPHVPFFVPIIDELRKLGFEVFLTARNSYQVCELLELHHLSCRVIGGHWGKFRALKVLGTVLRALQLLPILSKEKPNLAVCHCSRALSLSSLFLQIPAVTIFDYEFASTKGFLSSGWFMTPEFIPDSTDPQTKARTMKYPGLKEDVYIPRFRPEPSLQSDLGIEPNDLVVTMRPPATEAHYHNPEADVLFDAAMNLFMERPEVRVILLPRNGKQAKVLQKSWGAWIAKRKIVVPDHVVNGLNLIWFSDLVVSGGGTMNREAAALGVPVYSIFRGKIGAVDRYLANQGRLTLIEKVDEVRTKIKLVRRNRQEGLDNGHRPALQAIVNNIVFVVESLSRRQTTRR